MNEISRQKKLFGIQMCKITGLHASICVRCFELVLNMIRHERMRIEMY